MNLTPKQLRILQLIRDWRHQRGFSPTMQELANALGVSKVTIFEHVEALINKGGLERDPNKARSLSIPDDVDVPGELGTSGLTTVPAPTSVVRTISSRKRGASSAGQSAPSLRFPLVGKIAAGYPIEKFAQDDELSLEEVFGPRRGQRGNLFALQVDGDSMRDEGIFDGDYVIVERRDTARNGERVVALLPSGETTLKTLYREKDGTIRLQPANPEFAPIIVREVTIQGVVIGVLRRY